MVLGILVSAFTTYFPTQYTVQTIVVLATILAVRTYSQGRATNRERDLHARVILVTGGFTPLGLTILQNLAERGAHIIALSPHPIDSPQVSLLVDVLRTTTSNEQIYAEHCDLLSPASIQSFCKRFLSGQDKRLDAILFAHEYSHIGPINFLSTSKKEDDIDLREKFSLATFLLTTLLLPTLLTAPVERDIRIINVVNRFYAAAAAGPSFSYAFTTLPSLSSSVPRRKSESIFLAEGTRSLRTVVLTRHLQRILDALPAAQVPKTDTNAASVPVVDSKNQRSNIVTISVSPGISRVDTVSRLLNADWTTTTLTYSKLGVLLYLTLLPLLHIFTKSPFSAIQTVLHVLFLPTPFKVLSMAAPPPSSQSSAQSTPGSTPQGDQGGLIDKSHTEMPEEVLKPGALYAECAVVKLRIPLSVATDDGGDVKEDEKENKTSKEKGKGKAKQEEGLELPDDGELGGELVGRRVWETYEEALKAWEKASPSLEEYEANEKARAERESEVEKVEEVGNGTPSAS